MNRKLFYWNLVLPYLLFAALAIVILQSLLAPGLVLTLDMIPPEYYDWRGEDLFNPSAKLILGGDLQVTPKVPFLLLLSLASSLVPVWLVQRVLLFAIFFASGLSMYSLISTRSTPARYFAGLLYAINPFTYVRLLAGHWFLLLGYAVLPWALQAFLEMVANPAEKGWIKPLLLTTLVGVFSPHMLVLLLLIYLGLLLSRLAGAQDKVAFLRRLSLPLGTLAGSYLLLNLYWILPVATEQASFLSAMGEPDLAVFSARASWFNSLFSVASLYGFWRGGYIYAKDLVPALSLVVFYLLFLLAVLGVLARWKEPDTRGWAALWVLTLLLAVGMSGPISGPLAPLFEQFPPARGFRDSHKFVAILVLAYSYLGSLAVDELKAVFPKRGKLRLGYAGAVGIILALPLAYSFTIFGFWGQLKPMDYPPDWKEVRDFLHQDRQDYNVLFLPWHLYMDYHWLQNRDKRLAAPVPYFEKPVIHGLNVEMPGVQPEAQDPSQRYVEGILKEKNKISDFGAQLVPLNVKYVILAKEADYADYAFLYRQEDLHLIMDKENLALWVNLRPVSRLYEAKEPSSLTELRPLRYQAQGIARYYLRESAQGYLLLVPPGLRPSGWAMDGQTSLVKEEHFYALFPAIMGKGMEYSRTRIYLAGYILSIGSGAVLGVVALWRRRFFTHLRARLTPLVVLQSFSDKPTLPK